MLRRNDGAARLMAGCWGLFGVLFEALVTVIDLLRKELEAIGKEFNMTSC